jgi:phosphatidate cytidylyltransferase
MLHYRIIFGSLLVLVAIGSFWLDNHVATIRLNEAYRQWLGRETLPGGLVMALITVTVLIPLSGRELVRIFRALGIAAHTWLVSLAAAATCLVVYATPTELSAPIGVSIIASVLVAAFVGTLLWHSRHAQAQGVVAAAGAMMFSVALLGLMMGFYLAMRRQHSAWVVLGVLLITKSCDIGAYFTGRFLGRHRMIPWLSPKKTWEGLAGGVAMAALVAMGLAWVTQHTQLAAVYQTIHGRAVLVDQKYSVVWAAMAGVLLALVGQLGDLMMSLFKRDVGFKDSGSLLPGFGGVLDVLDSPLLVAPAAFWMLQGALIL